RSRRPPFLIVATALPILSYAIFAFTTQPAFLVLASIIGGVGLANGAAGALTAASFHALLAEYTPPPPRTSAFPWSQALWSMALALGALCAALPDVLRATFPGLDGLEPYRPPFVAIIGLPTPATVFLLPIPAGLATADEVSGTPQDRGWLPRRSLGVIVRYSVALGM